MINFKKKPQRGPFGKRKGFTLLELLISVSIFSITVVIGVNLFFNIVGIQKRTSYIQEIQGDARYVMEEIVRQLRQGYLDYAYYSDRGISLDDLGNPDPNVGNKILVTKDLDNNIFYFEQVVEGTLADGLTDRYVLENCSVDIQNDDLDKCTKNKDNWQTITSNEVHVKNFLIFPTPSADPLTLDEDLGYQYQAHDQPKVTIVFQTEIDHKEKKYKMTTSLQTTVSSRIYAR